MGHFSQSVDLSNKSLSLIFGDDYISIFTVAFNMQHNVELPATTRNHILLDDQKHIWFWKEFADGVITEREMILEEHRLAPGMVYGIQYDKETDTLYVSRWGKPKNGQTD